MVMEGLDPQTKQIAQAMALALQETFSAPAVRARNGGYQEKAVTFNANTQYAHGPRGVFNLPGVEPDMFSLVRRPLGIASRIPIVKSLYTSNFYGLPIYVAAGSGTEPASDCAPGPNPGDLNIAYQSFPFGKVIRTTNAIDVNRAGQLINSAEPLDLRVINQAEDSSPFIPDPARNPTFLTSELGLNYYKLGVEFERVLEGDCFTGDPGNNNPATAGRQYFAGLDRLINTGKIDANQGGLVPALDSLLVNWAGADLSGTVTLGGVAADIVTTLSSMLNYLQANAQYTNLDPVEWALVMRYDLWYALTALWPCSYLTNACNTSLDANANGRLVINGNDQVAMRDEMRNGHFLWINGKKYEVIITDQNTESATSPTRRHSDIYFVPLSAAGRKPLYLETLPFDNEQINEFTSVIPGQMWQSNNGLYFWTFDKSQYCITLTAKVVSRLILRLPQLAASLQNVGYTAVIPTFTSNPSGLYPQPTGGASVGSFYGALYGGY